MITITADSIIRRKDEILAADVTDDEIVLMGTGDWHYLGLNPIGTRIWRQLETGRTVASLCAELAAEFPDAPEPTIRADVIGFLTRLSERKLVEVGD